MEKSQTTTWDVKNLVNNGINYQPQLVKRRISEPSTVVWNRVHICLTKPPVLSMFLREPQQTPGAYPRHPKTPK